MIEVKAIIILSQAMINFKNSMKYLDQIENSTLKHGRVLNLISK